MSWHVCHGGPKLSQYPCHPHQQEVPEGSQQSQEPELALPASKNCLHTAQTLVPMHRQ